MTPASLGSPLSLLYRGPLASCNYDCPYCPFAKRRDSPEQLRADRAALSRFADWCVANPGHHRLSVLFTPWGEGLTRRWYAEAIAALSALPHVDTVAIQTNLAARVDSARGRARRCCARPRGIPQSDARALRCP